MSHYQIGNNAFSEYVESKFSDQKKTKLTPFDFVHAINVSKIDMFPSDDAGKREERTNNEYSQYIINRNMSFFPDTIFAANAANEHLGNVPNCCHFDFYRFLVGKKYRYAKWIKAINNNGLKLVCDYYKVSPIKALEYLSLFSGDWMNHIEQKMDHGGRK